MVDHLLLLRLVRSRGIQRELSGLLLQSKQRQPPALAMLNINFLYRNNVV